MEMTCGTLYIEGRLKDFNYEEVEELTSRIQAEMSNVHLQRDVGTDLLRDSGAKDILGSAYTAALRELETLRIVEYAANSEDFLLPAFNTVDLNINLYALHYGASSYSELPNTKTTNLPHQTVEGCWNQLVFNNDVKNHLIRMIANARFLTDQGEQDTNPVILLHGPPGTGKSTLCRGLAQKVSIRMSNTYTAVKLIEFKPASLLSKFYSESGQQVETLFQQICDLCTEEPDTFFCILIDEVESIARSRHKTTLHGEVEDSQRVTCELLKGIDNLKEYNNYLFLTTTNFYDDLDAAFLSRCAHEELIEPPSMEAQYIILVNLLSNRMDNKVISPQSTFLGYGERPDDTSDADAAANRAGILSTLDKLSALQLQSATLGRTIWTISGRSITLLVRSALQSGLRARACTLSNAFTYIDDYINSKLSRQRPDTSNTAKLQDDDYQNQIEYKSTTKRKSYIVRWDGDFDEEGFMEYTNTLRAEFVNKRHRCRMGDVSADDFVVVDNLIDEARRATDEEIKENMALLQKEKEKRK